MEDDDIKVGDDVWVLDFHPVGVYPARVKQIYEDGRIHLVGWEWDDGRHTLDKKHYCTMKYNVFSSLTDAVGKIASDMYTKAIEDRDRKKEFMDYWRWDDEKRYD